MSREPRAPIRTLSLPCGGEILELDLFRRCGCDCIACSREAHQAREGPQASFDRYRQTAPVFKDPETLGLHHDLPAAVRRWLAGQSEPENPSFVAVGLSAEALLGPGVAQDQLIESARLLLEAGVSIVLQTRRPIPDPLLDLLAAHRSRVRVAVPFFTPNEEMRRTWEPGTASTRQRLFTIQRLITRGVPVGATIRPLIPYVNDGDEHLEPLVVATAEAGARGLGAGFLRLNKALSDRLAARSPTSSRLILSAYEDRGPDHQGARRLPQAALRRRTYQRLARHARAARLEFGVCRCLDPELGQHPCLFWPEDGAGPAGRRPPEATKSGPSRSGPPARQVDLWGGPDPKVRD